MRQTVSAWFAEHPVATAALARAVEAGTSSRGALQDLREHYGYPFNSDVALWNWARRNGLQFRGTAAPYKPDSIRNVAKAKRAAKAAAPSSYRMSDRDRRATERCRDFIVTSAVNNCDALPEFVEACRRWADERRGRFLATRVRYKNPQTKREADQAQPDEWWDARLEPYLLDEEIRPHPRLSLMATKIQATANNPLPPRMLALTRERSAVFGHPQLAMRTVPTPQHRLPKLMYTTGAVTAPAYSDTLTGDVGAHHHTHAAVIVEVRGDRFHMREVRWDGESFVDYGERWTAQGRSVAPAALALILGDVHVPKQDRRTLRALFGRGGVYEECRPAELILHDLSDHPAINPHEAGKLSAAARWRRSLADERDAVAAFLNSLPRDARVTVVRSNHDDFLLRWLQKGDPAPRDARLYHELAAALLQSAERGDGMPNPLPLLVAGLLERDVRWLDYAEPHVIAGILCNLHGNNGPNGARGTPQNMASLGVRFIAGHVHSPWIWQGGVWVGLTGEYDQGYNMRGPGGWLHTSALIHDNGKTQMVHEVGGRVRG